MIENDQRNEAMANRKHMDMYQLQTHVGGFVDDRNSSGCRQVAHELETYGEHARRSSMARRERFKLIVQGFRQRMSYSAKNSKILARSAIREVGAQVGMLASRKLFRLAQRIEAKAKAIQPK